MRLLVVAVSMGSVCAAFAGCSGDDAPPGDAGGLPADSGMSGGDAGARDGSVPDAGAVDGATSTDSGAPPPRPACGTPTFPAGTPLRREPYLQSTTPTTVRVAWTTSSGGTPRVRWAPGPDGPWTTVDGTSEAFATSRTGESADFVAHDATLSGLEADRYYCYEVLDGTTVLGTGLSLHTAWVSPHALTILAFGDSGDGSTRQRNLRDRMLSEDFDIFLHLGDMAYNDGTFTEFEQNVFGIYQDFLHEVPTFPTIGNHEYHTSSGQPYVDVYYLFEQALRPAHQERYYSFDYGDVHLVALDSNPEMLATVGSATDDMVDWLRDDLARSTARWKIAFMHHPAWSSGEHGSNTSVQSRIVPALEEGGVDLVLAGHDHDYERTQPMLGDMVAAADARAITYVVAGAGGASLRAAGGGAFTAYVNDTVNNFLLLRVEDCNAHGEAITADGTVIDSFDVNGCE